MCQQIEQEEKQKERDTEAHKRWLQERQEKKIELERAWKPPVTPASPHRKKIQRGPGGNRRNSSQSEPSSEADSAMDSPLSEPLNVDVIGDESTEVSAEVKQAAPTPTSPLLTSLLKSPSPAPTAQSSILHSAITANHRAGSNNPTIASLLHSSPGIPAPGVLSVAPPPVTVSSSLKNLVTSAIGAAGAEDTPKPPSASPAAGAPTLSMLLELPPSLPGKPLPELPVSSVAKPPYQHLPPSTNKAAGEVCHPQHQEMRVRREVGTDEPVEVVEVEQNSDTVTVPNLRDQVVGLEVVVEPQDVGTLRPPHEPSQKLIDEELEAVSQAIADVEKMEREEQANRKALLEAKSHSDTKEADEILFPSKNILEGVKMLVEVPAMVETSEPEPQTVAEVIEVPAPGPSAGDLDIIIVDSSALGGQEEVLPDTERQMVEVILDGKSEHGKKQDIASEGAASSDPQETLKDSGEKVTVESEPQDSLTENKQDDSSSTCDPDSAGVSEIVTAEYDVDRDLGMDEASRIEIVAIEIPTSKAEEKEISKRDRNEQLDKEKEQSIKREGNEMVVEKDNKQETPASDRAVNSGERKDSVDRCAATKDSVSAVDSEGQCLENSEVKKDTVKSDMEKEIAGENLEDEVEENVEREGAAGNETVDEQCEKQQEDLPTAEPKEGSVNQPNETKKQDTEGEELMTKVHDVTEIGEAVDEDDSRAESSEDEKKIDKKAWSADHGEEAVLENASPLASVTGGKTWKGEEDDDEEVGDKKEKGASDGPKQLPDKIAATQKVTVRADTPSTEDDKTNDAVEPPRSNRRRGATATPVDSVPNSPAAPVTDEDREYRAWKKSIMLLYGRLATHKYASLFLRPITDDQAPGYSSIVHSWLQMINNQNATAVSSYAAVLYYT
ncbi:hypothetical protein B7P43_G18293 [Cryptotermes secundus]|uniref:Uncharacterized protein n=1 Tax=Cryptotermes secundus TaxID=105785 RepID=A0A2J7QDV6_9NEOP|nr:hypothetical protein B7P43_G18293 [Cryptotermes secundus]